MVSCFIAPTAPATGLQATATASTVTLSWQAPPSDETNGVLRMYTVTLRQPSTGQTLVRNTTTTGITISSLTPCTNYLWNVIPYTVAYGRVSSSPSITTLPLVTGMFVLYLYYLSCEKPLLAMQLGILLLLIFDNWSKVFKKRV